VLLGFHRSTKNFNFKNDIAQLKYWLVTAYTFIYLPPDAEPLEQGSKRICGG